jgi:menaquinol-cytochrome c reductase iron-sulfur subunit
MVVFAKGEENMEHEVKKEISRREFMKVAIGAIGGLITLGFGIPAIGYVVAPALAQGKAQQWIQLGAASKVELGKPTLFKTTITRQTGWIVNQEELSIYVLTDDGREYIAMSNVCTHLGCRIRWIADQDQYFCPCHNGVYDKQGNVVSGPPPRSLDRYQTKVENDQIFILGG